MKFENVLRTAGDGYWSTLKTAVRTTHLEVVYDEDDKEYGELRVFFDTTTWDVSVSGLIYTDSLFIRELRTVLREYGITADVEYSERGMQGDDYVSLDIEEPFINAYLAIAGE